MDMPCPLDLCQAHIHTSFAHRSRKRDRCMEWHNLVPRTVDQERRSGISAVLEVRKRRDGGTEVRRRRRRPGSAIVGPNAVEKQGQTVALFEKGEDKLRARVPWADPAEVVALASGGSGVVGCYLHYDSKATLISLAWRDKASTLMQAGQGWEASTKNQVYNLLLSSAAKQ